MGAPRAGLRYVFLVAAYVGALGFAIKWGGAFIAVPTVVQSWARALYYPALAAALTAKLAWAYRAWTSLPPACRLTGLGRAVPPDEAVWGHFIPWRVLSWQFTVHVGVAEATNSVLASYDTRAETSTRLPFIACACLLLPGVNLVLFPAFLFAHMESVDRAQVEMTRCLGGAPVARPWVPPHRPSHLSLVWPLVFASLVLWICVPLVGVHLLASMAQRRAGGSTSHSVASPSRIEWHADRLAEEMARCARLAERKIPGAFEACAEVDEPLRLARLEGGAEYTWDTDRLDVRSFTGQSKHASRYVVCDAVTCTVTRYKSAGVPSAAAK